MRLDSLLWRQQRMVDGALSFIQGKNSEPVDVSTRSPRQRCLRGVKKGFYSAGILKKYPAWKIASQMDKILKNPKQIKRFLKNEYKFVHLDKVKTVKDAPAYSLLVYEGAPYGHIEFKVPADYLESKGFTHALRSNAGTKSAVALEQIQYVYVSDYIDAFPRNHPSSRVANKFAQNKRPLKAVFQLQKI